MDYVHRVEHKDDVPGAKLRADMVKWVASKYHPEMFGDRTKVVGDAAQPVSFVIETGIRRGRDEESGYLRDEAQHTHGLDFSNFMKKVSQMEPAIDVTPKPVDIVPAERPSMVLEEPPIQEVVLTEAEEIELATMPIGEF